MAEAPSPPFDLMATRKTYHKATDRVTFGRPIIGPRVYLVKGPSGWTETFDRKETDAALEKFLQPLPVSKVIESFQEHLRLEGAKAISWSDVTGYLAHITNNDDEDLVPQSVAVAFWGQTILYGDDRGVN